jgi:3-methylcrotonyl-CoA carboxylase alpha subunit
MITALGRGAYRVEHDDSAETVYVAGPPGDRWVFWRGQVFRGDFSQPLSDGAATNRSAGPGRGRTQLSLTAPMPARVSRVLVEPGARVSKGETLIVLEAMKMELPVRAPADAAVRAIHCREGELVQADALLMDLTSS